jgi:hypothetical protein
MGNLRREPEAWLAPLVHGLRQKSRDREAAPAEAAVLVRAGRPGGDGDAPADHTFIRLIGALMPGTKEKSCRKRLYEP